jgi:coatomer subunit beta'
LALHTYIQNTLNYGMERVWTIACLKGSNKVALGYDDGTIMIKLGQEEPVVSMERGGKVVWSKNHDIVIATLKGAVKEDSQDGDRLPVATKGT